MKRLPTLMLAALLAIGAACHAGQHRGRVALVGNGAAGIAQQQPIKKTSARQSELQRLRAQRDSLNREISKLEKGKPTSSARKQLAKLRAQRDSLADAITQLLNKGKQPQKGKNPAASRPKPRPQKSAATKPAAPKKVTGKGGDKIEKIISKLQAKEQRGRPPQPPVTGLSPKAPEATPSSAVAEFDWPIDSRKILLDYGERYNPKTNTVTINPGVNIRADAQGNVSSAGPGRVTLVTWMPGYRTVVIVDHGAGYRTVYANLASATVRRGNSVRRGEQIGKAGGPKGGRYLHFQVWKERQRMNPMTLLR